MPDFNDTDLMHEKIEAYYEERQSANANLNILANALYAVMSNNLLKIAVFKYLQRGGTNAQESIAILAGLNRNPYSLMKQFCFVAAFGAWNLVKYNILNLPEAIKLLSDAITIIKPLTINELLTGSFFKRRRIKIKLFTPSAYRSNVLRP